MWKACGSRTLNRGGISWRVLIEEGCDLRYVLRVTLHLVSMDYEELGRMGKQGEQ